MRVAYRWFSAGAGTLAAALGMYSVAMLTFGRAAHIAFMEPLARFMLWAAVAAFLGRVARRSSRPVSGTPAPSADSGATHDHGD